MSECEPRPLPPRKSRTGSQPGTRPQLSTVAARGNLLGRRLTAPASKTARINRAEVEPVADVGNVADEEQAAGGSAGVAVDDPDAMQLDDNEATREALPLALGVPRTSAASTRLDFTTPAPLPAPLELESFEPQRTVSTISSQAAAAASLRYRSQELQLEKIKLERARIENDNLRMQLQAQGVCT